MTLASGKSLVIGAQQTTPNPSNYFKGSVEKLAIYQRRITTAERKALFQDHKLSVQGTSFFTGISTISELEILTTSTQQKWSYDSSNNATMVVASIGASTLANSGGNFTIDSAGDIVLDAAGDNIMFKDAGTQFLKFTNNW